MNLFLAGIFVGLIISAIITMIVKYVYDKIREKISDRFDAYFLPEKCTAEINQIIKRGTINEHILNEK